MTSIKRITWRALILAAVAVFVLSIGLTIRSHYAADHVGRYTSNGALGVTSSRARFELNITRATPRTSPETGPSWRFVSEKPFDLHAVSADETDRTNVGGMFTVIQGQHDYGQRTFQYTNIVIDIPVFVFVTGVFLLAAFMMRKSGNGATAITPPEPPSHRSPGDSNP